MSETKKPSKTTKKDTSEEAGTPETAASQPVIVTGRPIMKKSKETESAVEGSVEKSDDPQPPALTSSSGKPKLQPLDDSILKNGSEDKSAEESEATAAPADEAATATEPEEEQTTADQPTASTDSAAAGSGTGEQNDGEAPRSEVSTSSADDPQKSPVVKKAETEAAEHSKRAETVQKLVESKKYFLPINAVEKQRTKKFVVAGVLLSVLLVLLWINVALDAGILHIDGVKPVTHFF